MASCTTAQFGSSTCPQLRLTVTISSSTSTTATLSWKLEYVAHGYAFSTSVYKAVKAVVAGSTVYNQTYNINGKSSTVTIASGTKAVNKGTSAQTIAFSCSIGFNASWSGTYKGTVSANGSISVPAKTSYKITYNANGGSGAPGQQTKWAGTNITLSSTKPTRTGYSFQGWATSSGGSVAYAAGATYSANASVTLYAVWKANTYAVKYNANGGSGAPSQQTKTYGVALTLSSTKPTRTNYNFKGWGTSSGSTTVAYAAGASYTSNAAITLYAIWELAYTKPRITSLSADRCNSSGTLTEEGTYALVKFSWATDKTVSSVKVAGTAVTASGTSGTVSKVVGGSYSTESSYSISVAVADSGGTTTVNVTLPPITFAIDILNGGKGIAFGRPASLSGFVDVAWKTFFRDQMILANNKSIWGESTDGTDLSLIYVNGSDNTVVGYGSYNNAVGSTNIYGNTISLTSKNGIISTGATLQLTKTTDAEGGANNGPALIVGSRTGNHTEIDGNEVMAKASGTTTATLHLNANGGAVAINGRNYGVNEVLWSGTYYMTSGHTATLSKAISTQPHGIALAFSKYDSSTSTVYDSEITVHCVLKRCISDFSAKGFTFVLNSPWGNGIRYLYISDTKITGHDTNGDSLTVSGITYNNTRFVLRRVIGF